ncbi:MAG TPA: hypothetical protein VMN57_01300 [Anaerolineales bacterium]|nr:hypothetical protein [Anaerolineales bacterium]
MARKPPFIFFSIIILIIALSLGYFFSSPLSLTRQQTVETGQLLLPGSETVVQFTRDPDDTTITQPQWGEPVAAFSMDTDLRSLPQIGPAEKTLGIEFEPAGIEATDPNYVDPVLQETAPGLAIPGPAVSFAGLDLSTWGAGWPPDTNGDIGPDHYIQTVNTSLGIYSRTGTQLAAFTFDSFFSGTGTPCDNDNNGDPIVLYDDVSGRWIITDFAWSNLDNGPYYECIAVSKTADPVSGGWWLYGLLAHTSFLNDYPKLGVWHDGIYMTANLFDCMFNCGFASYQGVRIWALNRDDMIGGQPLNYQFATLGTAYFSLLPANARGAGMPAPGTPNYLGELLNSNTFRTLKLSIDWNNASNSTLTGPFSTTIASYSNASSVPQPNGQSLDSLAGRLMAQLQYSEVSGTGALWVTHSVSTSSRAAIRWYEFRNLGGTPSVFQQGTFSPDATHRWMGAVGVDDQGNMAVVYSASSSSVHPQIRYTGRLSGDPLGLLSQGEATLIAGTGSQTNFSRWGDYAGMALDPVDGCTFWFTTEYYISTGTNWQTRIGSFSFPGCSGGPTPTPGEPTATPTATPRERETNTPGPTATPGGRHTPTPVPTSTSASPTDTPVPGGDTMHVADLDGISQAQGSNRWEATVTITVVDQDGAPVAGATVDGSWSNGITGSGNCQTDGAGQCAITRMYIRNTSNSVTFTVDNVSASGYTYNPAANTDPDGDSDGSVIVINKP